MADAEVVTIPSIRAWHKRMFAILKKHYRFEVDVEIKGNVYTITGPDAQKYADLMPKYKEAANLLAQAAVHKEWPDGNVSDVVRQRFCRDPKIGVYTKMNDAFEGGRDMIEDFIPESLKT